MLHSKHNSRLIVALETSYNPSAYTNGQEKLHHATIKRRRFPLSGKKDQRYKLEPFRAALIVGV
jgi:hypothetical protein